MPLKGLLLTFVLAAGIPIEAASQDMDDDTVPDELDNCLNVQNGPLQGPNANCDTDMDGYGNFCDADFVDAGGDPPGDFYTGMPDYGELTMRWHSTGAPGFVSADMRCEGVVGSTSFSRFRLYWQKPPGPSGLACAGTVPCPPATP